MVEKLLGHWKLEKNENLDEYMKANKVNVLLRKVANSITSYEEIVKDGDTWSIDITSTFKSGKTSFKIGEAFTENTLDGKQFKCTFTIEGNRLVALQEAINKSDVPSRYEREVLDDGRMLLTCLSLTENVEAKRYYQPHTP